MIAAFVITTAQVTLRGKLTGPTTPYNEQMRMARYLLHGTGFVCPVGPERDDPSSWYAPGYIAGMPVVLAIFGEPSTASLAAIRLINIAAVSVAFGLYFLVGLRLFDRKIAWVGLVLMVLSPALSFKADEIWDTSWTMLGGAALLALFALVRPRRGWALVLSGLGCGAVAMINPAFTLCYPVWVVYGWWGRRAERRKVSDFLRYAGLVLCGFLITVLPWTIRNYRTFGELFYLRGNLPLEIWSGNAPWSDGYGDARRRDKPHPVFHESEARRMVELGEYRYFQTCRRDVRRWWAEDKSRFVRLTLSRIAWFWGGRYDFDVSRAALIAKALGVAGSTILAAIGTVVIVWKRRNGLILLVTVLVFPLMYYVTQITVRYRLPIEPLILLLGAVGLVGLFRGRNTDRAKGGGAESPVA